MDNHRMSCEKIDRRLAIQTGRPDFLTYMMKHIDDEKDTKGMSMDEIYAFMPILLLAGSETTATLLSGMTWLLLTHRNKYQKLLDEVRGAFTSESEINLDSVSKLKYLLAVLEESMRMYPPVPAGLPRRVPYPGDTVAGEWLPGGVSVPVFPSPNQMV
jgi:cytochrome P450